MARTRKPTWLSVATMMRRVSPSGGRCSCSRRPSLQRQRCHWVMSGGGGVGDGDGMGCMGLRVERTRHTGRKGETDVRDFLRHGCVRGDCLLAAAVPTALLPPAPRLGCLLPSSRA